MSYQYFGWVYQHFPLLSKHAYWDLSLPHISTCIFMCLCPGIFVGLQLQMTLSIHPQIIIIALKLQTSGVSDNQVKQNSPFLLFASMTIRELVSSLIDYFQQNYIALLNCYHWVWHGGKPWTDSIFSFASCCFNVIFHIEIPDFKTRKVFQWKTCTESQEFQYFCIKSWKIDSLLWLVFWWVFF